MKLKRMSNALIGWIHTISLSFNDPKELAGPFLCGMGLSDGLSSWWPPEYGPTHAYKRDVLGHCYDYKIDLLYLG